MSGRLTSRRRSAQLSMVLLAVLVAGCFTHTTRAARPGSLTLRAPRSSPGILTFKAGFLHGLAPWTGAGGGAQCANYGTPSTAPRLRGNFSTSEILGVVAGRFDLPPSVPGFPLEACELIHKRPLGLGTDDYYGYMFYVPTGWTTGGSDFWGVATAQFHFQNIWGSPIGFELHGDHMTLSIETGACHNHLTVKPGCEWVSNADNPNGRAGNLGAQYAVPPRMRRGVWHELIMHVHWAPDRTGQIQVWHRVKGNPHWTETVDLNGLPTVQWDVAQGCCNPWAVDKIGAYRGLALAPTSVWEANFTIGTSFPVVAATMPENHPRRVGRAGLVRSS